MDTNIPLDQIIYLCAEFIGAFVLFLITWIRTGSIKKSINKVEESMKFKTTNGVVDSESNVPVKQSFTPYRADYVLDPSTNEIVRLPEDKNVQVVIQSYHSSALDRLLERFITAEAPEDSRESVVQSYETTKLDLNAMAEAMSLAEEYRDQLGLDPSASIDDVYKAMENQSKLLQQRISDFNLQKKEDESHEASSSDDSEKDKQ